MRTLRGTQYHALGIPKNRITIICPVWAAVSGFGGFSGHKQKGGRQNEKIQAVCGNNPDCCHGGH